MPFYKRPLAEWKLVDDSDSEPEFAPNDEVKFRRTARESEANRRFERIQLEADRVCRRIEHTERLFT